MDKSKFLRFVLGFCMISKIVQVDGVELRWTLRGSPKHGFIKKDYTFECNTRNDTQAVRWYKDNNPVAVIIRPNCSESPGSDPRFRYSCDKDKFWLIIPAENLTDEINGTTWSCTDPIGKFKSNPTTLFVQASSNILFARQTDAIIGEEFKLTCETDGSIDGIQWNLEGKRIAVVKKAGCSASSGSISNYIYSCSGGEFGLTIPYNFMTEDKHNTVWECADFYGGRSSNTYVLYVKVPVTKVSIYQQSSELYIQDGQQAELICKAGPSRPSANISWTKGIDDFQQGFSIITVNEIKNISISTSILRFRVSVKDNTLPVFCKASNIIDYGSVTSKVIRLDISYPPSIYDLGFGLNIDNITENDNMEIICNVSSNPSSNITWSRNGIILKSERSTATSILTLMQVRCLDTGNYTCTADNGIKAPVSKSNCVYINCKPRLDIKIPHQEQHQTKYIEIGSTLLLEVLFLAYPFPEATWYYRLDQSQMELKIMELNSRALLLEKNTLFLHSFSLYLPNINKRDLGEYGIYVKNRLGDSNTRFLVKEKKDSLNQQASNGNSILLHTLIAAALVVLGVGIICVKRKQKRNRQQAYKCSDRIREIHESSVYEAGSSEESSEIPEFYQYDAEICDAREYQNQVRSLELEAPEPYDNLEEDDPMYNKTHYTTVNEQEMENLDIHGNVHRQKPNEERCDNADATLHDYIENIEESSNGDRICSDNSDDRKDASRNCEINTSVNDCSERTSEECSTSTLNTDGSRSQTDTENGEYDDVDVPTRLN